MGDKESFSLIDMGISRFNTNKDFRIDYDPHSDWLVFEVRRIKWIRDGLNYDISIAPNFNDKETISSWSMYIAAWYDKRGYRYHLAKEFVAKSSLADIANDIDILLSDAYNYINPLRKLDIPKAVKLS